MARTLSAALTAEMNSLERTPYGELTAERWLPKWTARISGLSGGKLEQYAHGHAAAVAADANGAGEDILFRARSGSFANPQDGKLYISIVKGADLAAPATWDGLWTDTGVTGLMHPAWSNNSGAAYGGSIAAAVWNNAGTWTGRVFYIVASTGALVHRDYNLATGAAIGGATTIATLGAGNLASMQIGACKQDEIFALFTGQVEASQAGWQKPIYGTLVRRYAYSGSWSLDGYTFPYHTLMEGHAVKDNLDYDAASTGTVAQWGKRPCGGLAVNEIDANTVAVTFGAIHWRRRGYWTHNAGLRSFIYHRDSGWWEPGAEVDRADFTDGQRLHLPVFARGCQVGGNNIVVWSRLREPADFQQSNSAPVIARLREVVWAKLSGDGSHLTHFERLGDQDNLTAAAMVEINHGGNQTLYAVGWRSVYESEMAAAVGSVDTPLLDLADYATGWSADWNNRLGMRVDADLFDPSPAHAGTLEKGLLVRARFGIPTETVQVAQGWIDQITPSLDAGKDGLSESAAINARADLMLQNTVAEALGDELAHNHIFIAPTDPIKHVAINKGVWQVASMNWPNKFFAGEFGALNGRACYRLKSFPFAQTGGDLLQQYKGSWFKDITWLGLPPRVEGAIEASVRFGDDNNIGNFNFKAADGNQVYATPVWSNGVITRIDWRTGGYGGSIWNTVYQYAVMAGLICHAPETGRKYAFVWEHQSNFASSSHTDDTWTGENFDRATYSVTGSNRLYLLVSDYSGGNWVHKDVATLSATGLTPGKPADLRMQVVGGTIYCFYRYHSTGAPNLWRLAFSHKSGRFGASQFGIIGRGHGGIVWDALRNGENYIKRTINEVDFWNIHLSDAVVDRTMEEHLRRRCWQGWTETRFTAKVEEASRAVNAGAFYSYGTPATNPTLTFKVSIPANTNEAGVFVRGVDSGTTNDCVKIGLVAHSTANSGGSTVNYYAVKRRFSGGAEVTSARAYSPAPIKIEPGKPTPVRVTARGNVYAIWVAGNFAGHFIDSTSLGLYFGLYATGGNATFSDIAVPELYEVPIFAPLKVNQSMAEAVRQVLSGRRIKAVFQYDGAIKFSYFGMHDAGPNLEDTLVKSDYRNNDRFLSVVRVEGAYTWAEYASAVMLARGRHFQMVHNPDIYHYEFAYREAQAIAQEVAERQQEAAFDGLPDLRIEPEDSVGIIVSEQGLAGDFLVDDVKLSYSIEGQRADMTIGARASVAL